MDARGFVGWAYTGEWCATNITTRIDLALMIAVSRCQDDFIPSAELLSQCLLALAILNMRVLWELHDQRTSLAPQHSIRTVKKKRSQERALFWQVRSTMATRRAA